MPASKKPRKKYRPGAVIANPIAFVMSGIKRATDDQILAVKTINHGAVDALVKGTGSREDWNYLNNAVNMALVLAEASTIGGYGHEYWTLLNEAQKALGNIGRRFLKWRKWQVLEPETRLLGVAMDVHHAQIEAATVKDIERAQGEVNRRVRDKNKRHRVIDQAEMFELMEVA